MEQASPWVHNLEFNHSCELHVEYSHKNITSLNTEYYLYLNGLKVHQKYY